MSVSLDNPVWASLATLHAGFARRSGPAASYPPQVAPFVAVEAADDAASSRLDDVVGSGETVLFVGPSPRLPPHWRAGEAVAIAQMVCERPLAPPDGPEIVALADADNADVLDLVARVYPHYFRPRTVRMGRYFGIRIDGVLAAIIGERMGFPGHRELSAICTDPDFLGRGLARRLIAYLANDILASGALPFLHVSHRNLRAKALYEHVGFRFRCDIALREAQRLE